MGKAANAKRERREQEDGAGTPEAPNDAKRREPEEPPRSFPLFWAVIGVLVVGGVLVALVTSMTNSETKKTRDEAASKAPTYAEVTISGDNLPGGPPESGDDPAVGMAFPMISGTSFENKALVIDETDAPMVVIGLAHWCPHCQAEVPRIVDWAKDGGLPAGVKIYAVSTKVSDSQPNFPPAAWLAEEEWPFPVLVDDQVGTAADALGLQGFPHIVFVATDGTVVHRESGEMPIDDFDERVQELAGDAATDEGGAAETDAAESETNE